MRDSRLVEFVETRETSVPFVLKDRYEFKPKGRLQSLQRWAWKFLHWRKAMEQAWDERITYTRHVIDTQSVVERLIQQRSALFDYGAEPKELLIGSQDFAELMGAPEIRQALDFQAEYMSGRRVMGLRVCVIPWMRGMLVMP